MTGPGLAALRGVCLDAVDPERLGGFWGALLGRLPEDAGQGDGRTPDVVLRGTPTVWVNGVPQAPEGRRVHLDVDLGPGRDVADLVALGATVLHEPGTLAPHQQWWVLADPEGGQFCAFPPEQPDADPAPGAYDNDADAELPA